MSGQQQQQPAPQQTIYTIHESQLNNGASAAGALNGQRGQCNSDLLIDTTSIPLTHQAGLLLHHQHQLQPQQLLPAGFGDQAPAPVTSQPASGNGARVAPEDQHVLYSVHPVFELLERCDALLVRQRADCTATCCGFESANTYTVRARDGTALLKAVENSNCCERCCFESSREFNLSLVHGDEVVARIRKPYRVSRLCCYSNAVRIESPQDNPIGHIRQLFSLLGHPRYAIHDSQQPAKQASFYLESVSCRFCFTCLLCTCVCGNRDFRVLSADTRQEVGRITRSWQPAQRAALGPAEAELEAGEEGSVAAGSQADAFAAGQQLFGVEFTASLEARQKLLLLSACFMMDFFYFETDRRRRKLASC